MSSSELPADRQYLCYERFRAKLKVQILDLLSEDLIDEHRQKPLGQHSDGLERVLNFFRRPPSFGLYERVTGREYQVIALPIEWGKPPQPLDDHVYTDQNEAMHAVFLKHVEALKAE
ncbi:MAG: hypothetical protein AAF420_12905 [Pseudomonadota bacterium]